MILRSRLRGFFGLFAKASVSRGDGRVASLAGRSRVRKVNGATRDPPPL